MFRCFGVFRGVPGCSGVPGFSGVPGCSGVPVFRRVPVFLVLVHAVERRWRNRLTRSFDSSGPVLLVKYPAIVKKRNNRD